MAKIVIGGQRFSGEHVEIRRDGTIIVDGAAQGEAIHDVVEVRVVEGTLASLKSDASIQCGDVAGNVEAGMSVTCRNVGGDVRAAMGVTCGDVQGSVEAGLGVRPTTD